MRVRFLVITDSRRFASLCRKTLGDAGFGAEDFFACDLKNGRKSVISVSPDFILLDVDGGENMEEYIIRLVPRYSVPLIVCTALQNNKYPMMQAGAIDVVYKPVDDGADMERFSVRLVNSVKRLVEVKALERAHTPAVNMSQVIAIGGSAGSTEALRTVLKGLRKDIPPVVAALHMPEGYTAIYAKQLDAESEHTVVEAKTGQYLSPGMVIVAAGNRHLRLFRDKKGYFVTSEPGVKVSGHCPSVDVLFDSVAYCAKENAIGVILTGMGSDGAEGMLNMKKMGAYNIGQDEESSVVYGMPKTAFEKGAVTKQCPLEDIADEIHRHLGGCVTSLSEPHL